MAMHNLLLLTLLCPRCGFEGEMEAEFRFGTRDLSRYRIGDHLNWNGPDVTTPKIRPAGGNYDGEAYVVCPHCERDFWLTVAVRQDVIAGAVVDPTRAPYIPDKPVQPEEVETMEVYSNRIASQPFILVRRIPYEEPYHIQLEIVVSSGMFRGSTDLYCGVQQLEELGAALQKFPAKIGDDYRFEYGSEDPEKQSYRHFVLRAYTVGSTGNCALQIRINQNRQEPEEGECRFSIEAEAAAVNRLGRLFTVFSRLEHLELRWSRQEDTLYPEYHLWDVPSAVISMDSMPHHHPEAPAASSPVNNSWDPKAYAEKMKKGKGDVSAFFLIDSPEAVSQCIRWLTVLKPYGMPEMEQSQYFADVREIYRAGRKLINFDYDFTLTHEGRTYPAKLRCHFMEPGKYEIELWLTGFIAAGIEDQFTDGHTGFFCAFMPPAFYD